MLAEEKSDVRKQEKRADFLDTSLRDLRRQIDSNRLEIYCTNQGYEESRTEPAKFHEELAHRERLLRETQVRSIHEVGELRKCEQTNSPEMN